MVAWLIPNDHINVMPLTAPLGKIFCLRPRYDRADQQPDYLSITRAVSMEFSRVGDPTSRPDRKAD